MAASKTQNRQFRTMTTTWRFDFFLIWRRNMMVPLQKLLTIFVYNSPDVIRNFQKLNPRNQITQ